MFFSMEFSIYLHFNEPPAGATLRRIISNSISSENQQISQDERWMDLALKAARKAQSFNEVPVGAVIVKNNQLISIGYNKKETLNSALGHAEIFAIHRASLKLQAWRLLGCTLYVTLEPCPMCAGALIQSRVDRVVIGTLDPKAGACGSVLALHQNPFMNHRFSITSGVRQEECAHLLKEFFRAKRASLKR